MAVTLRHDDEVWRRWLLTVAQCADAMRAQVAPLRVITTRDPLGQAILGKGVGFEAEYVDEKGVPRLAWIESIEDGPVLQGKGRSTAGERPAVARSHST